MTKTDIDGRDSFHLTDSAALQIAAIASSARRAPSLRISVSAGGCSGFRYGFDLDDIVLEGDTVVDAGTARAIVDGQSLDLLGGAILDWKESLMGSHFAVSNPNAVSGCGCGSSFSVA